MIITFLAVKLLSILALSKTSNLAVVIFSLTFKLSPTSNCLFITRLLLILASFATVKLSVNILVSTFNCLIFASLLTSNFLSTVKSLIKTLLLNLAISLTCKVLVSILVSTLNLLILALTDTNKSLFILATSLIKVLVD